MPLRVCHSSHSHYSQIKVVEAQLPYYKGKPKLLHLHSVVSMVDTSLAVAYLPLLPLSLVEYMQEHGIKIIEVPGTVPFLFVYPHAVCIHLDFTQMRSFPLVLPMCLHMPPSM